MSLSLKKHRRIFGTSFVFEFEETKKNYSIRNLHTTNLSMKKQYEFVFEETSMKY
jgi:hypothetical protein